MDANAELDRDDTLSDLDALPFSLMLELTVHDRDTIAELCRHEDGDERERFAQTALRIGVLALRQARGQIDADAIRRESERLLTDLHTRLETHSQLINEQISARLKEYFDPESGRFQERVDRLIRRDGELEQVLRRQIGKDDSELCRTLSQHFGDESHLMKILSPDQSKGLLAALRETLGQQLSGQREQVLNQFSLDNKESALSRFIGELNSNQDKLSERLTGKIDGVVKEFSLDNDDSALSRLVKNVDRAQKTITSEFSLDDDRSALSRMKKILENTNETIHSQLSLDDDQSALARLRRELMKLFDEHRNTNQKFQEEVKSSLQAMVARREEAERSTRHGLAFEDAVFEFVQFEAQRAADVASRTGNSTGLIKNCKVGDCLLQLSPESAAAEARVVIEAKEKANYGIADARAEIDTARKNRDAQVGLFVFSKKCAPPGIEALQRFGHDVLVVWDAEDKSSDLYLKSAISLARALCVRSRKVAESQQADFTAIDQAILEIEKRTNGLDDIERLTTTIQNNAEKVLKSLGTTRKSLLTQIESLQSKTGELKELLASASGASAD